MGDLNVRLEFEQKSSDHLKCEIEKLQQRIGKLVADTGVIIKSKDQTEQKAQQLVLDIQSKFNLLQQSSNIRHDLDQ